MHMDFHYKDKTVMKLSYLYDGNSYAGKTSPLYWDGAMDAHHAQVPYTFIN